MSVRITRELRRLFPEEPIVIVADLPLGPQSLDCLKTVSESQLRDFQAAVERGIEAMSQGVTATWEGMAAAKEAVSKDVTAAQRGR